MIYNLNKDFDLGQELPQINRYLKNAQWELEPIINGDNRKQMKITVSIVLSNALAGGFHRTVGIYDYSAAGTWEDADLENYVRTLPGFEDSMPVNNE